MVTAKLVPLPQAPGVDFRTLGVGCLWFVREQGLYNINIKLS